MNNYEVDSTKVSYVFPKHEEFHSESSNNSDSGSTATSWFTSYRQRHKSRMVWRPFIYLFICVWLIFILSMIWCFYSPPFSNRKGWDNERMERLGSVMLEQVRSLMVTANRSIHDPVARHLLRNLSKEDSKTCYSPNCLHTGLSLLESMNFSVDPCEDFYEFACGSWAHSDGPVGSLPFVVNSDHFTKINEKVIRSTQRILEGPLVSDLEPFQQAQKFYAQCKDLDQLEKEGLNSLWRMMDRYGGWPLLQREINWNNTFDWISLAGDLQRLSCSSILSLEVKQHPVNPLQNAIYVVQPKFFISKEYLISPSKYTKIFNAYRNFIISLAAEFIKSLGDTTPPDWNKLHASADDIIKFESSLAKISANNEEQDARTFRKAQYTIGKLQHETDLLTPKNPKNKIDWDKFMNQVFYTSRAKPVVPDERLIVHDIAYVRRLAPLLATTSPTTLANYLMWRLLVTFTTGTTHKLRRMNFEFYSVVYGMKKIPPRASICATVVKDIYALAVGMKIVRDLTDTSSKKEVEMMVENVRVSMENFLAENKFGPDIFPVGINRKLSTLKHCIGYPASFSNVTEIKKFYHSLDFDDLNEAYLNRYMRLRYWLYDKTLDTLRDSFDSDCWSGTSWGSIGEAYAYYDTARNSINFPIGLLQAPFYRHNVPLSINYGAIGAIIGHEISHSINIEGWIRVGLIQNLEDYWKCLEHFYSNYHVPSLGPNVRVNGLRTRSENLADHLGLATSYLAYQKLLKETSNDELQKHLVGFDMFTQEQIFFLSFAHMWCVNGPDEWLADELESSSHTPGIYRVLGTLQNSEDFAKAWKCPAGSSMNPTEKCSSIQRTKVKTTTTTATK